MNSLPPELVHSILCAAPYELVQLLAVVCRAWNDQCRRLPKPVVRHAVLLHFVRERNGRLLLWAREGGRQWPEALCEEAALHGDQGVVEWLHARGCPWGKGTSEAAARGGHLSLLCWVYNHGCPLSAQTSVEAAASGDIFMIDWLDERQCRGDGLALARAAELGHTHILQWLLHRGYPRDTRAIASAAGAGRRDTLLWLWSRDFGWEGRLKYRCPYAAAAMEGHTDVMRWLHEHGCPILDTQKACDRAASRGHLSVLRWLFATVEIDDWLRRSLTASAALHGQVGVLIWLGSEGCRADKHECELARARGHDSVVRWLHGNGLCGCRHGQEALEARPQAWPSE